MKLRWLVSCILLAQIDCLSAEATGKRKWTATSGHNTTARAISATATAVTLELDNGKTVALALDKLVPADREFIEKHFKVKAAAAPKAGEPQRSAAASLKKDKAPHPLGAISGPITSAPGSTYHIYLPATLKEGRKAPVLHFNGAGGYQAHLVKRYFPAVERFGWIMIASVESKNKTHGPVNLRHAANNIAHIKKSPLVDPERIYFTGHSGGGAMSWWNAAKLDAAGTMPVMSYIPPQAKVTKGHHFVLSGATDYNRYAGSRAAALFKKDAYFRAYPGGHQYPSEKESHIYEEGIAWLTARYLETNSKDQELAEERLDFEAAMINWINELTPTNPHQAYHLTQMLTGIYGITGKNAEILKRIESGLAVDASHKAYHEGVNEIHEFGVDTFGKVEVSGSASGHNNKDAAGKARRLAAKYEGIPFVAETFTELAKPTVK